MGVFIAQFIGHPYLHLNHKATHLLLQFSVIGLGFGMNINTALKAGKEGLIFTVVSIFGTIFIGFFIGKVFKINKKTSFLFKSNNSKVKIPYFIGLFVLAMVANTYIKFVQHYSYYLTLIAKSGLTLTLFLIGCGLSKKVLYSVGFKPLFQGIALWIIISRSALWAVNVIL